MDKAALAAKIKERIKKDEEKIFSALRKIIVGDISQNLFEEGVTAEEVKRIYKERKRIDTLEKILDIYFSAKPIQQFFEKLPTMDGENEFVEDGAMFFFKKLIGSKYDNFIDDLVEELVEDERYSSDIEQEESSMRRDRRMYGV